MKIIRLNEAFSPSMPDWLKGAFEVGRKYSGFGKENNFGGVRNATRAPGYGGQHYQLPAKHSNHPAAKPLGKMRGKGDSSEYNLWDWAITNGLDINNAKFISGPIPENARDPRLKGGNMPIWHLSDGNNDEVYFVGANDNATSRIFGKLFKQTNPKQLKEFAIDFCYLDEADKDINFSTQIKDKQDARLKLAQSMDKNEIRQKEFSGMIGNRLGKVWNYYGGEFDVSPSYQNLARGGETIDPSGYVVPDLSSGKLLPNTGTLKKYAKELSKKAPKQLSDRFNNLVKEIDSLWREYPGIASNIIASSDSMADGNSKILDIYNAFSNISKSWKTCKNKIDELMMYAQSPNFNTSNVNGIYGPYLTDLEGHIGEAKDLLNEYIPDYTDWDAEEVEWEDF